MVAGLVMGLGNNGPIVDRAYTAGGAFQWARETFVNSMQANATRIYFGVEWQAVRVHAVYRRLIADDGEGMYNEQLVQFFNTYGGSGRQIGIQHENFGVGAKTSLLPWNNFGVVVCSWKNGQGSMIRMMCGIGSRAEYGLKSFECEDGSHEHVIEPGWDEELGIDWAQVKPSWITEHGTVVVLLGSQADQDTILNDPGRDETGQRSLIRYLNTKIWDLPDSVTLEVLEFAHHGDKARWPRARSRAQGSPTDLYFERRARGLKYYIGVDRRSGFDFQSGAVAMPYNSAEVTMHWYLWGGERQRQ